MAPAIALATEPAEVDVMRLPPRPRSERLLSPSVLLASYLLWGLIEAAAGFAAYAWAVRAGLTPAAATGGFFAAVVVCQVASVMVWRTTRQSVLGKGLLRNRAVLAGIAVELVLTALIVYSGPGQALFGTAALPAAALLVPVPFALGMVGLSELLKAAARARTPAAGAGGTANASSPGGLQRRSA
jgi:sodium/potassium-transporting ATPase subunit alpha